LVEELDFCMWAEGWLMSDFTVKHCNCALSGICISFNGPCCEQKRFLLHQRLQMARVLLRSGMMTLTSSPVAVVTACYSYSS
jgi:hypothetical protein